MKYFFILFITFHFLSCSSGSIVQQHNYNKSDYFMAQKVLVVGLSANSELRRTYESELVNSLKEYKINAVRSIDFFETSFTNKEQTVNDLNKIEKRLLNENFDAILLTKIVGVEKRFYPARVYFEFMKSNQTFEDYLYGNQYVYLKQKNKKEDYTVYLTESLLFCICPEKDRELLWKAEIEVKENKKSFKRFRSLLFEGLITDELLIF